MRRQLAVDSLRCALRLLVVVELSRLRDSEPSSAGAVMDGSINDTHEICAVQCGSGSCAARSDLSQSSSRLRVRRMTALNSTLLVATWQLLAEDERWNLSLRMSLTLLDGLPSWYVLERMLSMS